MQCRDPRWFSESRYRRRTNQGLTCVKRGTQLGLYKVSFFFTYFIELWVILMTHCIDLF